MEYGPNCPISFVMRFIDICGQIPQRSIMHKLSTQTFRGANDLSFQIVVPLNIGGDVMSNPVQDPVDAWNDVVEAGGGTEP
jgi:hypothetical protein